MMPGGNKKNVRLPPPLPTLQPVPREDSVEKLGVQISDHGSLQIDLIDGKHVVVRPVGVSPVISPAGADPAAAAAATIQRVNFAPPPGTSTSTTNTNNNNNNNPLAGDQESSPLVPTTSQSSVDSRGTTTSSSSSVEFMGKIRWEDLKMGHVIGEGVQAKVRKVKQRSTNIVYALKVITLGKQATKKVLQQELARVLSFNSHPNVVTSYEAFFINGALKILMEYMDLGTLSNIVTQVGPLPESALSCVSQQILRGLGYLHQCDIIHRDIKPSNLLVNSSGFVKISDFGVSTLINSMNPFAVTLVGSTAYMSPERVRAHPYGTKSDIWSVGMTVAQCVLGVFPLYTDLPADPKVNPFERKTNMFDLATLIAESRAKVHFDVLIPKILQYFPSKPVLCVDPATKNTTVVPEVRDFVEQCMRQEDTQRPSCAELLATHPFIIKFDGKVDLKAWFRSQGIVPHKDSQPSSSSPPPHQQLPVQQPSVVQHSPATPPLAARPGEPSALLPLNHLTLAGDSTSSPGQRRVQQVTPGSDLSSQSSMSPVATTVTTSTTTSTSTAAAAAAKARSFTNW